MILLIYLRSGISAESLITKLVQVEKIRGVIKWCLRRHYFGLGLLLSKLVGAGLQRMHECASLYVSRVNINKDGFLFLDGVTSSAG